MKILGVILAGGQSSRMGTNKALLSIGDDHLLTHMQKVIANTAVDRLVLSGPLSLPGTPNIIDIHPKMGPLGGIFSVFQYLENPEMDGNDLNADDINGVLFVPVDLPLITSVTLNKLILQGEASKQACYFEGSNLPLYLPYSKSTTDFLSQKLVDKDRLSIGSLIRFCDAQPITLDSQIELTNTNTPVEWAASQEILSARI
jgi:molybdenum cofactor guanylyltransferase